MEKTFKAVYENGVLRPLIALDLENHQLVQVTVSVADDVASYFDPADWETSKHDNIGLTDVRQALSSIRGSLSDAVTALRDERF